MSGPTKETLKTYFETNDLPTQSQFAELIDATYNGHVVVQQLSDLGTPDGSQIIHLTTANTTYDIVGTVGAGENYTISIEADGVVFEGHNANIDGLASDTTSIFITSTYGVSFKNIFISATNASGLIDCTGTSTEIFLMDKCITAGGTSTQIEIDSFKITSVTYNLLTNCNNCLLISGAHQTILVQTSVFEDVSAKIIDLNGSTSDAIGVNLNTAVLESGSTFMSVTANSANINTDGEGTITDNKINMAAGGTGADGYNPVDARWWVTGNNSILSSDRILPSGFGFYVDGVTGPSSISISTTPTKLLIDGLGAETYTGSLPNAIRSSGNLWDTTTDLMTPIADGDSYSGRIDLTVSSSTGAASTIFVELDIGGDITPTIVIATFSIAFPKSAPFTESVPLSYFTRGTFLANGGQFFLSTDANTATVTARAILIERISSGAN